MRCRPLAALAASCLLLAGTSARAKVVINEIDYDQPGIDTAEFVELMNVGPGQADLGHYSLLFVNGNFGGSELYQGFNLSGVLVEGDVFVVCANSVLVPNCDLDVFPDSNLIQNGAPDAVGLRNNGLGMLEDRVSYEGNSGPEYTETSGVPVAGSDNDSTAGVGISRTPDGQDTDDNSADFTLRPITPGLPEVLVPRLVINEVDYDQPGLDTAEFVELLNLGPGPVVLDDYVLELVNGSGGGATLYQSINLSGVLPEGEFFVVCGSLVVPNCDLDGLPDTDAIQNGAPDAIGLRRLSDGGLEDAVSYEGNSGAPYTEGVGLGPGLSDSEVLPGSAIARTPDGTDSNVNNVDFTLRPATPGLPEAPPPVVPLAGPLALWLTGMLLAASAWRPR